MSIQEAKSLYQSLKSSGDLKVMYSSMTGDWSRDKNSFIKQYRANEDLISKYYEEGDDLPT